MVIGLLALAACNTQNGPADRAPTATLAPLVSMTPRYTATPVSTRTPLPTFTFTPSDTPIPPTATLSLTPSPTEPVIGIVNSLQTVNVREGPGGSFSAFVALKPGTGVQVIGVNQEGTWYNVLLDDGRQGWIAASVLRLKDTPTPFPSATPSPNLTALFLGTPLPTAILGGGTVTPTPPRSITTATPGTSAPPITLTPTSAATKQAPVPVIDLDSINLTATALSVGIATATTTPSGTQTAAISTPNPRATAVTPVVSGTAETQQSVNVFALCDDPKQGIAAPTNLAVGSTITVWWGWTAKTESQIQDHLNAATYDVRVDDTPLTNLRRWHGNPIKRPNDYVVYWYVPFEQPLTAGQHKITYRVTWSAAISDGISSYGPGTNHAVEEGSCTFVVR
jgi:hypothetical protein